MSRHISRVATGAITLAALMFFSCAKPYQPEPEAAGPTEPDSATASGLAITESIHNAALEWIDLAMARVGDMVPIAEEAVDRLAAGGSLWVAGNEGFCDELHYRAGGFSFIRIWKRNRVRPGAVILMGHFKPNDSGMPWIQFDKFHRFLNLRTPMVVHFTSLNWAQDRRLADMPDLDFWSDRLRRIDTCAPAGESLQARAIGQMATCAMAWAFQAEMISAATRKGKTLATYASDHEPGGKGWDMTVAGRTFHPTIKVPPIPAGKLGKEYLGICRDQIRKFLATQPKQVRLAARRMARCMKRKGMIWLASSGEVFRNDCVIPRDLPIVWTEREYNYHNVAPRMPRGDMLLWIGHVEYPRDVVKMALDRGCDVVTVSLKDGPTNDRQTHISGCWKAYDSAVKLPKYPIRVLPTAGVVQTLQWYSILSETAAAYQALSAGNAPAR